MRKNTLLAALRSQRQCIGVCLSLANAYTAESLAQLGFDYACIDLQHGLLDYQDLTYMLPAISTSNTVPLVRVPWNEPGIIGKMLDAGAHGVIVPMVNSVEEAEAVVRACRYAPEGSRSFGPSVAGLRSTDYPAWATDHVAVIPMIETLQAVDNIDAILAVPGIDAIYVGPADLSLTLGLPPGNNDGDAAFADAFTTIVEACARADVIAGCHANGTLTPKRTNAGFRMVTVTTDLVAARLGYQLELDRARAESPARPASDGASESLY